jgi:hypothetical protein
MMRLLATFSARLTILKRTEIGRLVWSLSHVTSGRYRLHLPLSSALSAAR